MAAIHGGAPADGFGNVMSGVFLFSDLPGLLGRLRAARRILLALDFDGTLAPIAGTPDAASLPRGTAVLLRRLAAGKRTKLAILSGRAVEGLKAKVPLNCIYAGNHGLEIAGGGISFVHDRAVLARAAVEEACHGLDAALAGIPGALVERKGLSATVHYRCVPPPLLRWMEATVRLAVQPFASSLQIRPARMAWEIRPLVEWNKGAAVRLLLERMGPGEPLVVSAGDDATDEDMFRAVPDAISIQVGRPRATAARYRLGSPAQLAAFLRIVASESGGVR